MNHPYFLIRIISKILILAGVVAVFALSGGSAYAAAPQMSVKNNTNPTYSTGSTYASSVRAEPGDTLEFQMFGNGNDSISFSTTLPTGLTYVSTSSSNPSATVSVSGQTITWSFASNANAFIKFTATVVSGSSLSTNHSLSISYANNVAVNSDNATVTTGPIVTGITPSTGNNSSPVSIAEIIGHGLLGTTAVTLSDGTNSISLDLSGATIADTSITGLTFARVPVSQTPGAYRVLLTVTSSGNQLTTNNDATETVQYTATTGVVPTLSAGNTYANGVLTLNFSETIDVSQTGATNVGYITLADAVSGGNSLALNTATTVSTTDSTTVTFTLVQSDSNQISAWGQSASTLYVRVGGSAIYGLTSVPVSNTGRVTLSGWTKDTAAPTAAIVYTQNSAVIASANAGDVIVTVTFNEQMPSTPKISINQPGTTDITTANMSGSGTTWTYTYAVNADNGVAYVDGTATVTVSASDYAGNAVGTVTNNTFTIDTLVPSTAITDLAGTASGQTAANFSWTPTYHASDFAGYKFYWRAESGVTSANGTLIDKNTSGYSNLSASDTATLSLSSLSAGTNYYAVIYICHTAGNCSPVSNEVNARTQDNAVNIVPQSGGGGGGGTSLPTTNTSTKNITSSGGSLLFSFADGSSVGITIESGTFASDTSVSVAEASAAERSAALIDPATGTIIGGRAVNITVTRAGVPIAQLDPPLTVAFSYTDAEISPYASSALRVAYFDKTTAQWVVLASTLSQSSRTVFADVDHLTLFALIGFVNPPMGNTETTEPQQGQILGSSIGVYPNGTLLKAPDSPTVWYLAADQKHLIRSASIFESQFNWNDIITLPSSFQLDAYEQGSDVAFEAGTLVKEAGNAAVYRVSATGGVQPIVSEQVFFGRGYSFNAVVGVESGFLSAYPHEDLISDTTTFFTGDLVKRTDNAVHYVENNTLRLIVSASVFYERAFRFDRIRAINEQQFSDLAAGPSMTYPDGTLIKGNSPSVYVISDGKKRPIVSGSDFEAMFYQWGNIVYAPASVLAAIPESAPISLAVE